MGFFRKPIVTCDFCHPEKYLINGRGMVEGNITRAVELGWVRKQNGSGKTLMMCPDCHDEGIQEPVSVSVRGDREINA